MPNQPTANHAGNKVTQLPLFNTTIPIENLDFAYQKMTVEVLARLLLEASGFKVGAEVRNEAS